MLCQQHPLEDKYQYIQADTTGVTKEKLCRLLEVSRSAYYDWTKRPPSGHELEDQAITREIVRLHERYPVLGLDSLYQMVKPGIPCSRKRVWRLMKQSGIHSTRKRAYRRTTNSNHKNPIAPNLLMRNFKCDKPGTVWVGDITYIPTGEGWLYLAVVKDLCLKKVVGYAFSERIDTKLTLEALNMAVKSQHTMNQKCCLLY